MFGTDSHTCNAGAFGQFATGIGNTDAGFILGTGKLLIKVSLEFRVQGWVSRSYVTCQKDLPKRLSQSYRKYYCSWPSSVRSVKAE